MNEFIDAIHLFIETTHNLKKGTISLQSPLEQIVVKTCGDDLAYADHRKDAKQKYGHDFWSSLDKNWLKSRGIVERLLYSNSWQFPDFLFKAKEYKGNYIGGSVMELKDSKAGSIASFNSTVPTKYKTLNEIDIINGNDLVSRIARVKNAELVDIKEKSITDVSQNFASFERRCFYLVRTHKGSDKAKLSIVDGSFFETVPKDHLFYQMFMNVLQAHLEKRKVKVSSETLGTVKETLSYISDQTLIAGSQVIEGASVKPRLRIMAEVHPEGSPHSSFYPEITEGSFNLILQSSSQVDEIERKIRTQIPEIDVFSIHHKRNGEHIVFQLGKEKHLTRYL